MIVRVNIMCVCALSMVHSLPLEARANTKPVGFNKIMLNRVTPCDKKKGSSTSASLQSTSCGISDSGGLCQLCYTSSHLFNLQISDPSDMETGETSEAAEDNSSLESHKQIAVILNTALPPPSDNHPPCPRPPPCCCTAL